MSAFALKALACLFMLTDHIGAVFYMLMPVWLRWIGRIAFPIFVWFIAEGCARTRNIHRYLFRLGVFALLSEIPFDAAFNLSRFGRLDLDFLALTNVFYTMFLGVLAISVYAGISTRRRPTLALLPFLLLIPLLFRPPDEAALAFCALYAVSAYSLSRLMTEVGETTAEKSTEESFIRRGAALAATVPVIALGDLLETDYGSFGVAFIVLMYLAGSRRAKLAILSAGIFLEYGLPLLSEPRFAVLMMFGAAMLAVPLLSFYNGRRGPEIKWAFYAFYPVHLAVLALIFIFIAG
ncbi:MAG: conjugal transfer protein TraX [Gracilibacteraceae bacterium]|jgi:hypothetical protein|nr:conjugal transfer protein TraX [Gracilibacteraceae bacterium]